MNGRRVTVYVGHFGSGKTEIALNRALDLAAAGVPVTLADLDVVKPYVRTRSAKAILEDAGIDRARRPLKRPNRRRCSRISRWAISRSAATFAMRDAS